MKRYLDIKAATEPGEFDGYCSVFYVLDGKGDIILPGAFKESLPKFMAEGFLGGMGHRHDSPIGRFLEAKEDSHGLYIKAKLSDVPDAVTVHTLLKDKVVQKLSVGILPNEAYTISPLAVKKLWENAGYTPDEDDLFVLSKCKSVRVISRATLREVSPVALPANNKAKILNVKSASTETPPAFQEFITRGRAVAWKLAMVETKEGRVLSGRNETKIRAMVEVMTSVVEELNNLLALVASAPIVEDGEDEEETEQMAESESENDATGGSGKDKQQTSSDKRKIENDEEFAKQRGADKKSGMDLETKDAILRLRLKAMAL